MCLAVELDTVLPFFDVNPVQAFYDAEVVEFVCLEVSEFRLSHDHRCQSLDLAETLKPST
jgi:hypothetical protein